MDEMKLKLSTKFMRGIVAKLLSKAIYAKYGYKVNIQLNDLAVDFINGETTISTSVEVKLASEEFTKIVKSIGIED